ncbi:MAG: SPOR domain-containing protein [Prevotellaceae bacterium]|nr:SPOR domain-containing protein [Prevotellaceae bacterium]
MISLSRHIELLLLEHDCVIVPGIGGFIANHAEAQYNNNDDALFLPPYRTIRFNQQLQMNDGLLVQSYMAAYDASYPAAYLQMEQDIEKVICELDIRGEYTFDKLGVLRKNINQNIVFTPSNIGILTPSLYGLYSYEIKSLSDVIKDKQVEQALSTASAMTVSTNTNSKSEKRENQEGCNGGSIRRHRHRRWIDFGISVAAAIVLLFCFSYQALKNTSSDTDTIVATFYSTHDTHPIAPATNITAKPSQIKKTQESSTTPTVTKQTVTKEEKQEPAATPAQQEPKFAIVLASFVNKTNADAFIENLSKQGFTEGRYVKNDNVSRILYSNYADKTAAQQALQELRQQSSAFADGWILEL